MSGIGKLICVTRASGHIASWLVKLLLQRGYTVKAFIRDPNDPKKAEHLLSLERAKKRLHLFKANLLEERSFDFAIDGCDGVFHTASPAILSASDPQLWYPLSKTLSEEAAWKFAKENGIDLVTIHPALVVGPLLQPTLNSSVELILNYIVDVARAHVQAFEIISASGRYCLVGYVQHNAEVLKNLHEHYPALTIARNACEFIRSCISQVGAYLVTSGSSTLIRIPCCEDDRSHVPKYEVSKERAKSLEINFTPLGMSLRDTFESLKEKGFFNI